MKSPKDPIPTLKDDNTPHWYVAFTRSCQEKKCVEALGRLGVESYLPIRQEMRKWSDRLKKVDVVLIPRILFVRTTKDNRVSLLQDVYGLVGYMSNGGANHPVIVPDNQLEEFRFFIENSEEPVTFSNEPLSPGDRVTIVSGPLKGLECEFVTIRNKNCIAVRIDSVGVATIEIKPSMVKRSTTSDT